MAFRAYRVFDPPPEAAVTPGRRWLGHRVSRNLACRILGLAELGIEDDIETEGNRAIFRRRRSWLFRRTVPGREVEVTVGGTTLKAICDLAGHFHVSGEVQEHELSNFAGLGLKEQEEELLSSKGGGLDDVARMTRSASFSASLSEVASQANAMVEQLPLAGEEPSGAQTLPLPEPEPEIEPVVDVLTAEAAAHTSGSSSTAQRATPVSSPVRGASPMQHMFVALLTIHGVCCCLQSMSGVSVVNVVATGASAPERRQGLWRGGGQRGGSPRLFTPAAAELLLIPPEGLSIISDIDDTVKLSDVLNKRELLRNTFLREFVPVDGMASLYRHWEEQHDAVFHYVSASPWQLQPELESFLRSTGFPPATFHLKSVRVNALPGSGDSLLNLLEKGASFKPRHIEVRLGSRTHSTPVHAPMSVLAHTRAVFMAVVRRGVMQQLMQNFPRRSFWLVGDSGEQDPEAYGRVALAARRDLPDQEPVRIFIRTIKGANNTEERFLKAFEGLDPESWTLFGEPAELQDRVIRAP